MEVSWRMAGEKGVNPSPQAEVTSKMAKSRSLFPILPRILYRHALMRLRGGFWVFSREFRSAF
jgi:hypothetical protein